MRFRTGCEPAANRPVSAGFSRFQPVSAGFSRFQPVSLLLVFFDF
jgi:hypothetical protein